MHTNLACAPVRIVSPVSDHESDVIVNTQFVRAITERIIRWSHTTNRSTVQQQRNWEGLACRFTYACVLFYMYCVEVLNTLMCYNAYFQCVVCIWVFVLR